MELANILELIHAVSDSDLTEFNLQDDTLNISMSKEKTDESNIIPPPGFYHPDEHHS